MGKSRYPILVVPRGTMKTYPPKHKGKMMRHLSAIISSVARRVAAIAGRAFQFIGAAYVASLNAPGIYLAVGSRGTRYVGQTRTTMMKRWRKHVSDLRRNVYHNTPLQDAVNSGEYFVVLPLEYLPRDSAPSFIDERERHWIAWAGSPAVNVAP